MSHLCAIPPFFFSKCQFLLILFSLASIPYHFLILPPLPPFVYVSDIHVVCSSLHPTRFFPACFDQEMHLHT